MSASCVRELLQQADARGLSRSLIRSPEVEKTLLLMRIDEDAKAPKDLVTARFEPHLKADVPQVHILRDVTAVVGYDADDTADC